MMQKQNKKTGRRKSGDKRKQGDNCSRAWLKRPQFGRRAKNNAKDGKARLWLRLWSIVVRDKE